MTAPIDLVPEQRLRESFLKHAARAQLHRLCHHLARADDPADLRDALATIRRASATANGPLERCDMDLGLDGTIAFNAVFGDGGVWGGMFQKGADLLPNLVAIDASPAAPGKAQPSADHRIRSVIHYFFALVENPARDPEPFVELLSDAFSLYYTADPLQDFEAVRAWVTGRLASVVASEHDIHRITCQTASDGGSAAEVVMKSQALFPDGSGAISRNTQRWTLHDDPSERFPRITQILIDRDAVDFFGPAPDYEPRALPG